VQLGHAADEGGALLDGGRLRPGAVRLIGCGDRGLQLGGKDVVDVWGAMGAGIRL